MSEPGEQAAGVTGPKMLGAAFCLDCGDDCYMQVQLDEWAARHYLNTGHVVQVCRTYVTLFGRKEDT